MDSQISKNSVSPSELIEIVEFKQEQLFKDKMFLQQKYVVEKKTLAEIAKEIGSSRSIVLKYLKEFGLPTRERTAIKRSSNCACGQKVRGFRTTKVKEEQERIKDMLMLEKKVFHTRRLPMY